MVHTDETPSVVVLKDDKLYGELIKQHVRLVWPKADVHVFQKGFDALDRIQDHGADLFITGVNIVDMDGLEHLEPFIETKLPIMVITSRKDLRTLEMLREIRFNGLYDGHVEGMENLPMALEQVMDGRLYVSATMIPHLRKKRSIILDTLTDKEQLVFSVISDGSDDQRAATLLGLSWQTVKTHRKAIMRKLQLHHRGELMLYAVQNGYLWTSPDSIHRPGYQRKLSALSAAEKDNEPPRQAIG